MRAENIIGWDIRKIHKSLKKVGVDDLRDGDRFFMGWSSDPFATPLDVVLREGVPCLSSAGCEIRKLQPNGVFNKIGPKVFKRLTDLQAELFQVQEEAKRIKDEQEKNAAHLRRLTDSRYVVWNFVVDFDDVPDRDGFLVEVYDGRGKMLLRYIWVTMETTGNVNAWGCDGDEDIELSFVKLIAKLSMDCDAKIEPVIVYCNKID